MRVITAGFGIKVGSTVLALGGSPARSFHVVGGHISSQRSSTTRAAATVTGAFHGSSPWGGRSRARTSGAEHCCCHLKHFMPNSSCSRVLPPQPLSCFSESRLSSTGQAAGAGMEMAMTQRRQVRTIATAVGAEGSEIFCNRELNMKQIKAVGFDMDYTLAQYFTAFDQLAFDGAKQKLMKDLGYPKMVDAFEYDPELFSRGLVIDLERGNIIKMDRHKYIRVAFHGFKKLKSEERKQIYLDGGKASFPLICMQTFTGRKYVSMDTLFSLVDAVLYAHLVELKDNGNEFLAGKSYERLFRDVRKCVDLCHRDGVIKDRVEEDPARYIVPDPDMVPMLKRFREEGVQVFLLTNSLWDYTHVVMNFLCGNVKREDRTSEWLDLFDVAITGACKPSFLVEPYLSLFRVDEATGDLRNTDGVMGSPTEFLAEGKVFQGGNWLHLHDLLSLSSGDQLLYVGDHMFADILRSKRTLGWRTCLIVPELESEMNANRENRDLRMEVNMLRTLQYNLDTRLDDVRLEVMKEGPDSPSAVELAELEEEQVQLKSLLRDDGLLLHSKFHPDWGQLFKSGYQDSRFATQVATYACIYTSKASNLARVSTQRSFRPVRDVSAHDLILEAADTPNDQMEALRQRVMDSKTTTKGDAP
ncbi:unnamed protein product [Scytosiphon promiscuus]